MMNIWLSLLLLAVSTLSSSTHAFATRRAILTMKRGRGSFQKESGKGIPSQIKSMSGDSAAASSSNKIWIPVAGVKSAKDLPAQEGKVVLVDTMVPALVNGATNPTGAVSVIKYGPNTYCVSAACASCKIPLTKARILEPNEETNNEDPRLACDFCSATYNLRTGERVESVTKGLMGGVVKGLFSSQGQKKLPVYELGESKGKVVINLG